MTCSCGVSEKVAIHVYDDNLGPSEVVWTDLQTNEKQALPAVIRTAKIKCLRCGHIWLQRMSIPVAA